MSGEDILERRRRLLGAAYRVLYDVPLQPVRGEGVWLYERDGTRILDAYNNVPSVGHCHPRVVEALSKQAATLNTHTRYLDETILDYAEELLATFPSDLGNVMLTCTGSEANDLAIRIARTVTGNMGLIVTENAYHGVTVAVSEISPSLGAAVGIGNHVRTVPAPDSYRIHPAQLAARFRTDVESAIASLAVVGLKPAALMVDTVFASDGLFVDPPGFLAPAVECVRKAGGIFVADEVQAGLGRTGRMWGFERHGVTPDLVTLGKPMGDGHPLAGVVSRRDFIEEFGRRSRYFNTFGGNPVSAAVGRAVLEVIRSEGLVENAAKVGDYLGRGVKALQADSSLIGDVRYAGLYMGVEIVSDRGSKDPSPMSAAALANTLRREGVLVGLCGKQSHCLKIRPPLPFSMENADYFLEKMRTVLARVGAGRSTDEGQRPFNGR